ncbi:hypothetical protein B0H11DRAFT_2265630 [Mycena galericulata]|nr:hypothetical protein B0H11DRAFT_2265630 [Mycena galericulata]
MPRIGTAARKRDREGLPPAKPGKVGWVHGTKIPFFEAVGQLYLEKYGYNTAWEDDLEEDQDVADDVDPDEDVDSVPADVAVVRAEYFDVLRKRIGVWYNARYGGSLEKRKAKKVTFKVLFDKPALEPPAPVKPRTLHYYSRKFYDERIKPLFTARWGTVSRRPDPPAVIKVRNAATKEAWEAETAAFKKEVILAIDNEHKIAKEAYSMAVSGAIPTTAEEYNIALNNSAYYLQPFADAINERFGMNVAIMMCGPIPDRGGRIEVRSIHAGMSNGLVPRIWADYNRGGFDAAQRSFIEFTHKCFTEEECRERSWKEALPADAPTPTDAGGASSSGITSPQMGGEGEGEGEGDGEGDGDGEGEGDGEGQGQGEGDGQGQGQGDDQGDGGDYDQGDKGHEEEGNGDEEQEEEEVPTTTTVVLAGLGSVTFKDPTAGRAYEDLTYEQQVARNKLRNTAFGKKMRDEAALGAGEEPPQVPKRRRQRLPVVAEPVRRSLRGQAAPASTPAAPVATSTPAAATSTSTPTAAMSTPAAATSTSTPAAATSTSTPAASTTSTPAVATLTSIPAVSTTSTPAAAAATPISVVALRAIALANAPAPRPEGGVADDEDEEWSAHDAEMWPAELQKACNSFTRGKAWGGDDWKKCVDLLIALERAWGFPGKGLLSAPAGGSEERPEEIPTFMRGARKWGAGMEVKGAIGLRTVEASFSGRWWKWWSRIQPPSRHDDDGKLLAVGTLQAQDWDEVAKTHGRNGLLLYLGALFWWGEAVAGQADETRSSLLEDWRQAADDFCAVLEEAVKGAKTLSLDATAGKKGASKKRKAGSSVAEKENEDPRYVL